MSDGIPGDNGPEKNAGIGDRVDPVVKQLNWSNRMKNAIAYLLQIAIGIGVAAEHWHGIVFAGNLAFGMIWITILLSFLALFMPPEKFFTEKTKRRPILWGMFAINVGILIGAGWFFTGIMWTAAWLAIWIKRTAWEQEQEKPEGQSV